MNEWNNSSSASKVAQKTLHSFFSNKSKLKEKSCEDITVKTIDAAQPSGQAAIATITRDSASDSDSDSASGNVCSQGESVKIAEIAELGSETNVQKTFSEISDIGV